MGKNPLHLIIDTPEPGILRLVLCDPSGTVRDTLDVPWQGHVDNLLLTAVDKLLKRNSMDRLALEAVQVGSGVDKSTTLYRIVKSFASAITATTADCR